MNSSGIDIFRTCYEAYICTRHYHASTSLTGVFVMEICRETQKNIKISRLIKTRLCENQQNNQRIVVFAMYWLFQLCTEFRFVIYAFVNYLREHHV